MAFIGIGDTWKEAIRRRMSLILDLDPRYLWDIWEERFSLETQISGSDIVEETTGIAERIQGELMKQD